MFTKYWVRTQIRCDPSHQKCRNCKKLKLSLAEYSFSCYFFGCGNCYHKRWQSTECRAWSQETWSPNTGYAHRFRPGLQIFMFFLFLPQAISETKSTSPGRKSLDGQKWWVRRGIGHGYCHPKNTYRTKCQLENWTEGMVVQARKQNEGCIARFADS